MQAKIHELTLLFWECTLRCDLACRHCGSLCSPEISLNDMPLADFLSVLDRISEAYDSKKIMIALSGGEPLLRGDLEECGQEFINRKFPWGFVTNGYSLTQKRFDRFVDAGLHAVSISLDGTRESHNWLRNRHDAYDTAIRAISIINSAPHLLSDVITCVYKGNIDQLKTIHDELVKRNVRIWRIFTIFPMGRAGNKDSLQLSGQQLTKLFDFIKHIRKNSSMQITFSCEGFLGGYELQVRDGLFYCRSGINVASILVDGSIGGCLSIRQNFTQGSIYNDDFIDVWENHFSVMRERAWMKSGPCRSCSVYKWCNGGGLHYRNENHTDQFVCHYNTVTKQEIIL